MLSNDTKQRRQVALNKKPKALQSTVTDHFKPEDPATKTTPYSGDKAFLNAAIEWLIGADLVNVFLSLLSEKCVNSSMPS